MNFWLPLLKNPHMSLPLIIMMIIAGVLCAGFVGLLCIYLFKHQTQSTPPQPVSGAQPSQSALSKSSQPVPEQSPLSVGRLITFLREQRWIRSGSMHQSMITMLKMIRTSWGSRQTQYRLPWYVMVGGNQKDQDYLLKTLQTFQTPLFTPVCDDPRLHGFLYHQALIWDWHMGPDPPDDAPWRVFLELLKTYRPRRPLDGVIVVLPFMILLEDHAAQRQEWMLAVYKSLWSLQKRLGMHLPVSILISHSDQIPGLQTLVQALPHHNQEIWGWSNPHSTDTTYDSSWADAFVHRTLDRFYTLSMTSAHMSDPVFAQALLQFTHHWRAQTPVWCELLTDLFKPSSLHEPFMLRGLYFTGMNHEASPPSEHHLYIESLKPTNPASGDATSDQDSTCHKLWGLRDVFFEKIFPEAPLARPLLRAIHHQTRAMRWMWTWMGGSALILSVGVLFSIHNLHRTVNSLIPVLHHIGQTTKHIRAIHEHHQSAYDRTYLEIQGHKMLEMMPHVHLTGLHSLFLPITWISHTRSRVETLLTHGYDTIVMGGRGLELVHWVDLLKKQPLVEKKESNKTQIHPVESQDFQRLKNYVEELKNLEEQATLYNRYQSGDLNDHLQSILTIIESKSSPWRNTQHLHTKRKNPHKLNLSTHEGLYRHNVSILYKAFLTSFFSSAPLEATTELSDVLRKLQDILNHPKRRHAWEKLLLVTQELNQELSTLEQSPMVWLAQSRFSPGSDYDALMLTMGQMITLGMPFMEDIVRQSDACFLALKDNLKDQHAPLVGPILEVKDQNLTALPSPDLLNMKNNLTAFINLSPFQATDTPLLSLSRVQGPEKIWDEVLLQEILQRIEQFETFQKKTLPTYHPLIQGALGQLGLQRLQTLISALLASAHCPIPHTLDTNNVEENLKLQIQNFQKNMPSLIKIMNVLKSPERSPEYATVRHYLRSYAVHLARKTDHLFQKDHLYDGGADPFHEWSGEGNAALMAFHAPDMEELKYLLTIHRERAGYWANLYMQPLLQILSMSALHPSTEQESFLGKWPPIVAQVQAADKKTPGNSIGAFEHFLLNQIKLITPQNCVAQTTSALSSGTDYFSQKLNSMIEGLQQRCESILWDQTRERYDALATLFNTQLAGRVPFIQGRAIKSETKDASWSDIRMLYTLYMRDKALFEAHRGILDDKIQVFLKRIDQVCMFFKPFVDHSSEDLDPSVLDITVDVSLKYWPQYSQGLSSISGWSWQSGAAPVTLYSAESKTHWHWGQPTTLGLEWTHSSPCIPYDPGHSGGLSNPSPYEANYTYQGPWSLLRMILKHQATTKHTEGKETPSPGLLALSFPTRPLDPDSDDDEGKVKKDHPKSLNPAQAASCPSVLGFARLTLWTPSKDKPLSLKVPSFPDQAPPWSEPDQEAHDVFSQEKKQANIP